MLACSIQHSLNFPFCINFTKVLITLIIEVQNAEAINAQSSRPIQPIQSNRPIHKTTFTTFSCNYLAGQVYQIKSLDAVIFSVGNVQILLSFVLDRRAQNYLRVRPQIIHAQLSTLKLCLTHHTRRRTHSTGRIPHNVHLHLLF